MMNEDGEEALESKVLDKRLTIVQRDEAANRLALMNVETARTTFIRVAADESEDVDVLRMVGRSLGTLATAHGYLSEWELRDMSDVAYEAYCESYRPQTHEHQSD